ncbi:PAP2-domain-containing protein [Lactifluus volemus]|nr:PAP2-domain-containing protein [Lactifluus volemus]
MALASLDLTHVLYDDSSYFSLAMALVTLSPILLMPSYAALAIVMREMSILNMWAGQFCCEAFNLVIKRLVKQARPPGKKVGNGYGFPSSHSQYMGYFATFLLLHLHFRHTFVFRAMTYSAIIAWTVVVAYSRYHLSYHSVSQILWGLSLGISFGFSYYVTKHLLGRARAFLLMTPIFTWLRIRDGWLVWPDGGLEHQWQLWYREWRRRTKSELHVN